MPAIGTTAYVHHRCRRKTKMPAVQLALDRAKGQVMACGNFIIGEAFHLVDGKLAQRAVFKLIEQPLALFRHLRSEERRRLAARHIGETRFVGIGDFLPGCGAAF